MSGDFAKQIATLLARERARQERVYGGAMLQLQRMVVTGTNGLPGTPKDTGQAMSNWFLEAEGISGKITEDTTTRNLGLASAVVVTGLGRRVPVKRFYLFNNLPYIRHLEYGLYPNPPKKPTGKTVNGYSTQAPQGFFSLAVKRWDDVVKEVANK